MTKHTDARVKLGQILRARREELGLPGRKKVAKAIGFVEQTVISIENGTNNPGIEQILTYVEYLKFSGLNPE